MSRLRIQDDNHTHGKSLRVEKRLTLFLFVAFIGVFTCMRPYLGVQAFRLPVQGDAAAKMDALPGRTHMKIAVSKPLRAWTVV